MIARLMVRLGLWLARRGGWTPPEPSDPVVIEIDRWGLPDALETLVGAARPLIAAQDATAADGTSGEYKRHQVYAQLLKAVPDAPKRLAALAIEVARWTS